MTLDIESVFGDSHQTVIDQWQIGEQNFDSPLEALNKMITAEEERMLREISAEPVKVFLQTAILSKAKGDSYNYNHIVHQLRIRDDQDMVATVYVGLSSCVSQFTPR